MKKMKKSNILEQAIDIAECFHCDTITLNAESDTCACGGEFYPVSKLVPPGTMIRTSFENVVLRKKITSP